MPGFRSTAVIATLLFVAEGHPVHAQHGVSQDDRDELPRICYLRDGRLVCVGAAPASGVSDDVRGGSLGLRLTAPWTSPLRAGDTGGVAMVPAPPATGSTRTAQAARRGPASGRATRIFAGPGQFPPEDFAAYAIIVFKSKVVPEDRLRRINACRGYTSAILTPAEVAVPRARQLVTVWPVSDDTVSDRIDDSEAEEACGLAVDHYGLAMATKALRHVRHSRLVSREDKDRIDDGRGPFIFAWNPGEAKGQEDALILRVDMSDVATASRFRERFVAWRDEVERRQDLWIDGWREEDMWGVIGTWADRWGGKIMTAMGWGPDAPR